MDYYWHQFHCERQKQVNLSPSTLVLTLSQVVLTLVLPIQLVGILIPH